MSESKNAKKLGFSQTDVKAQLIIYSLDITDALELEKIKFVEKEQSKKQDS